MGKLKSLTQTLLITATAGLAGCGSMDIQFTRGPPVDMQGTHYEGIVEVKADEFMGSNDYMDWKKAAKLYQSVGKLKERDEAIIKYFDHTGDLRIFRDFKLDNREEEAK